MKNKFIKNITQGIENLLLHKLRSLLTMLGMVFGVGSVVAMLSVGEGAGKAALDQIRKLGSHNIIINSQVDVESMENTSSMARVNNYGLTWSDYDRMLDVYEHVKTVVPAKLIRKSARFNERNQELRIVGTNPEWFDLVPRDLLTGRLISADDVEKKNPVAVLTETGARKILAATNTVGQVINLGGDAFEVIGIIRSDTSQGGSVQMTDTETDVYIPINVARSYFGDLYVKNTSGSRIMEQVELHQIIIEADDIDHVESTANAIESMLGRFHKKKDYAIYVPLALKRQAEASKRTSNIVLGSIACISLLVGGIGIMNIMLASVTERTREIGVRRAIGARKSQIIMQFLIETVVLSTIGGLIGVLIGVTIPIIIEKMSAMPTVITLWGVMLPLSISVIIGIAFGIYPAIQAANVDPIVALRHE
ncbi:MAG: ABC transporter permease [Sedimentisphaerales bacterium]|nr:ABC transporter permease [Sedimentisphaerales bacterium]